MIGHWGEQTRRKGVKNAPKEQAAGIWITYVDTGDFLDPSDPPVAVFLG